MFQTQRKSTLKEVIVIFDIYNTINLDKDKKTFFNCQEELVLFVYNFNLLEYTSKE